MNDYDEIALRIAEIIISPDSALGFIHGMLSVPVDLGYLVYGYLDTESHYPHETERIRITYAIANGILNHDRVIDAIQIVFSQFNKYVTESEQNKIYSSSISSLSGRTLTNAFLSVRITNAVLINANFFVKARGGLIGNILLAGGMMERCIRTSEHLSVDEPEVYEALRHKDYDLLYFLFEPALKPFVDALSIRRTQGMLAFNQILQKVESTVNGHHG